MAAVEAVHKPKAQLLNSTPRHVLPISVQMASSVWMLFQHLHCLGEFSLMVSFHLHVVLPHGHSRGHYCHKVI